MSKRTSGEGVRYDVRWRDPAGRARKKTFRLRCEADAWRREVERAEAAGLVVDPEARRTLVREVAERWLRSNPAKRDSTRARDRSILETHVLPALGDRRIGAVTRADVQEVVDGWAAKQAASTVGRQHSTLRAVFAYAVDAEMIDRNPAHGVRRPRVRLVDRPTLDAEVLDAVAGDLAGHGAMVWLGAVLGLRWAEAAGVTVGAVDVLGRSLRVRHQLGRDGRLVPPKSNAGIRTLALPSWLAEDLAGVIRMRGLTGADSEVLLFVTGAGTALSYTNWRSRSWRPACQRAGVATLRFHDLRAMAATALIAGGVDIKTAQTRLGHATPQMTLGLYARATADADRRAADVVGALFAPSRRAPRHPRAIDTG